jgi:hypothetical protein
MPDSVTVVYRLLATEDFLTSPTVAQVTQTVLGVGNVLVTPFVLAAGDAAAAVAGVNVGELYVNSAVSPQRLRVRMT